MIVTWGVRCGKTWTDCGLGWLNNFVDSKSRIALFIMTPRLGCRGETRRRLPDMAVGQSKPPGNYRNTQLRPFHKTSKQGAYPSPKKDRACFKTIKHHNKTTNKPVKEHQTTPEVGFDPLNNIPLGPSSHLHRHSSSLKAALGPLTWTSLKPIETLRKNEIPRKTAKTPP